MEELCSNTPGKGLPKRNKRERVLLLRKAAEALYIPCPDHESRKNHNFQQQKHLWPLQHIVEKVTNSPQPLMEVCTLSRVWGREKKKN
jgi:hypothetical protein